MTGRRYYFKPDDYGPFTQAYEAIRERDKMSFLDFLKRRSKGVDLSDLQSIALTFVVIGIISGVGVLITTQMEDDTTNADASNALNNSTRGITNLTARLPLIGTVAGFIVLLGFVIGLLVRRMGQ